MSTKIYNGIKLNLPNELDKVHNVLKSLQTEITEISSILYNKEILKRAIYYLDILTLYPKDLLEKYQEIYQRPPFQLKEGESYLGRAWLDINNTQQNVEKAYNPNTDFMTSIVICPKTKRDQLLGVYFVGNSKIKNIILTQNYIEEYSYFDNTDRPENIVEKDWNIREEEWNEVVGHGPINKYGLIYTLCDNNWLTLDDKNLLIYMPTRKERLKQMIQDILLTQTIINKIPANEITNEDSGYEYVQKIWQIVGQFNMDYKQNKYQIEKELIKNQLMVNMIHNPEQLEKDIRNVKKSNKKVDI